MPVRTVKRGDTFKVVDEKGKEHGSHKTKDKAQKQATAINISQGHVPGVTPKKG